MLIENMKMAFSAIRANKMRSALTMLGIIIGIGSVIGYVFVSVTIRHCHSRDTNIVLLKIVGKFCL